MEDIKNTAFNEEISERVNRFLRKEMSVAESKAFIEDVKSNPELKECYQRQFNLMRAIKFEKMTEIMKAKEAELSTAKRSRHVDSRPIFARYKYVLSTVAVAAAMVCGVFIWDGSVTKSVGQQMYSVVMRDGSEIDTCVELGDYQKAIELIDEELGKTYELGDDPEALAAYTQEINDLKYRKALVYLKMGKKRSAKAILKELDDERSKEVLDKLLW
jgi:tetratricopeptide (TPR) repeat protein